MFRTWELISLDLIHRKEQLHLFYNLLRALYTQIYKVIHCSYRKRILLGKFAVERTAVSLCSRGRRLFFVAKLLETLLTCSLQHGRLSRRGRDWWYRSSVHRTIVGRIILFIAARGLRRVNQFNWCSIQSVVATSMMCISMQNSPTNYVRNLYISKKFYQQLLLFSDPSDPRIIKQLSKNFLIYKATIINLMMLQEKLSGISISIIWWWYSCLFMIHLNENCSFVFEKWLTFED